MEKDKSWDILGMVSHKDLHDFRDEDLGGSCGVLSFLSYRKIGQRVIIVFYSVRNH